jgi:hypothetical protein
MSTSATATEPGATLPTPVLPVICDSCRAQGEAGEGQFSGVGDILPRRRVAGKDIIQALRPGLIRDQLHRRIGCSLSAHGRQQRTYSTALTYLIGKVQIPGLLLDASTNPPLTRMDAQHLQKGIEDLQLSCTY